MHETLQKTYCDIKNEQTTSQPPNKKTVYLKTCTLKMKKIYFQNFNPTYVHPINKNNNLNLYLKAQFYNSLCHSKYI
jgi:hypothetical protein